MSDFKKETRYIVLKLSKITDGQKQSIYNAFQQIKLPPDAQPECVVVESDWPNYEKTWEDIMLISSGEYQQNNSAEAEDLSMLVKQLVRQLRKANPCSDLPDKAMDYLQRKGLQGSPFRRHDDLEIKAKAIYESWSSNPDYVPWVDGGNSLMQDEARKIARKDPT